MLRPSPNHGTQRLPNDADDAADDDDDDDDDNDELEDTVYNTHCQEPCLGRRS